MTNLRPRTAASKSNKRLFLVLFDRLLLLTVFVSTITAEATASNRKSGSRTATVAYHAIIKSSCGSTLYPELCLSTLYAAPDAASKVQTPEDVIEIALNMTIATVQHNYLAIKKLNSNAVGLTERERTALKDCLELVDETLDELNKCDGEVHESVQKHAEDLKSLLSAAMTNQETCLDGFSHEKADKKVRKALIEGQLKVFNMSSNVLAMIKNFTDTKSQATSRKKLEEQIGMKWPEWLSAGDRRLLQAPAVVPDVTVAADGSGNFRTVAEAVAAAPEGSTRRYVIKIKAGVYKENVEVPKKKTSLMFVGDGRTNTIITGSRNVVDGSTTFHSATVAVVGDRFLARDITFQNTAGPSKHQAVALRVGSDLSAFFRCDMLAYQDTLYVHSLRQFYIQCFIAGTVDFIFGNAAAVFQNCDIHARRPNSGQKNMVTAQGREDPNQNTGIVIQKCRIEATSELEAVKGSVETYLGRPWKQYSRTIIMQSSISDVIHGKGWFEWSGNFGLQTLFYAEYQNSGPGSGVLSRVNWGGFKVISSATEAQAFTAGSFISGASWLGSTGFPFSLGL
ncbi:hypothetical protein SLEP1_g15989 [Rubroshorea leprosula]|uniref:Pectinesterase n=1 Tax=Rubroshorea leprosula TaxID=152421 RepID=A0AAV5IV18_9ROSI|nr:hypothetical protein SLEP1_g15989 [Rubroshorea leprosula]